MCSIEFTVEIVLKLSSQIESNIHFVIGLDHAT
jgi:hypothetical protein